MFLIVVFWITCNWVFFCDWQAWWWFRWVPLRRLKQQTLRVTSAIRLHHDTNKTTHLGGRRQAHHTDRGLFVPRGINNKHTRTHQTNWNKLKNPAVFGKVDQVNTINKAIYLLLRTWLLMLAFVEVFWIIIGFGLDPALPYRAEGCHILKID